MLARAASGRDAACPSARVTGSLSDDTSLQRRSWTGPQHRRTCGIGAAKNLPEAQCLVARTRHYGPPIWRHCEMKHPGSVTEQCSYPCHPRVLPENDFVARVPMRAEDHILVLRPHHVAHLRARGEAVQCSASRGVPRPDALVHRTAARCKEASLMWRPCQGLHCGLMLAELHLCCRRPQRPDADAALVTPGGQLLLVLGPSEAADLLGVALKPHCEV
mmetsp:Transcript_74084/g.160255  ORF Transcript_74084/g.160255 Transcript_74084/m.160255 type:complete len:218 (-) Transcript_74084:993-1646(-)